VEVQMSWRERELLLDCTLADPEYTERLRAVPGGTEIVGSYTLSELEDLLGSIAAAANHTEDPNLQKALDDALSERLAAIQESYDDGLWQEDSL
jgi:hypothetical protein